jgi:hypothetical protein
MVHKSTELMKHILTILFIGLSTLNAQVYDSSRHPDGFYSEGRFYFYDSLHYPGYQPQQKFDTVKVKIMYEQGDAIVPMFIKGWQVIQLNKWMPGDPIFHKAYGYHEQPDKWEDVGIFLFEDKRTRIDTTRKWGYKKVQW